MDEAPSNWMGLDHYQTCGRENPTDTDTILNIRDDIAEYVPDGRSEQRQDNDHNYSDQNKN
ncbi:MAG: hypothetical protein ACK2TV_07220 [Anaerolineales bacterium]|jgi:hypothetical protein